MEYYTNNSFSNYSPNVVVPKLTPEDACKLIQHFTKDQLLKVLKVTIFRHINILDAIRCIANHDPTKRKLFMFKLSSTTNSATLRSFFSSYGPVEDAYVVYDKVTRRSKEYRFLTFMHVDGALLALKDPIKEINDQMIVTDLFKDPTSFAIPYPKKIRACLVRAFVFCFGFVIFYFIEVGTLILIWIQDCKKNSVWYIVLVS